MENIYTLFEIEVKVILKEHVGRSLELQDILRFSGYRGEDLHYEGSTKPSVQPMEIMIPFDQPISLLISPNPADEGTPDIAEFLNVSVELQHGIIIHPRVCHYVKEAGRFIVLKIKDGWKFTRKMNPKDGGNCQFQEKCKVQADQCPNPYIHSKNKT